MREVSLTHPALSPHHPAGGGLGQSDVAYFLVSSMRSRDLEQHIEELLRHWHAQLTSRLSRAAAEDYPLVMALEHFDLALLDYVRFLVGWGSWGYGVSWAEGRARQLLAETSFS